MRALIPRHHRQRAGLTLLETLIAVLVATALIGAVGLTLQRADRAFQESQAGAETERLCERALERLAREFVDADRNSITLLPAAPLPATTLQLRRTQGWSAGSLVLGGPRRLRFELDPAETDDGLDNDGDGHVDEGRVVLTTELGTAAENTLTLVENVRALAAGETADGADENGDGRVDEPGFFGEFDAASSTLRLRLTLERRAPDGGPVVRSAQISVRIRNG